MLKQENHSQHKKVSLLDDASQQMSSDEENDSRNLKKQVLETEKERKFSKLKV